MSRPSTPCIARPEVDPTQDRTVHVPKMNLEPIKLSEQERCGRDARYYDKQRGGMVCALHLSYVPNDVINMIQVMRNILGELRRHRDIGRLAFPSGRKKCSDGSDLNWSIDLLEAAIDKYSEKANNTTP